MKVTEVRFKRIPAGVGGNDRIQAFASVTLDEAIVIHDLRIIRSNRDGSLFLAFPSHKITDRCGCGAKNHLRAKYCNDCGVRLEGNRAEIDERGHPKLHVDLVHPINSECREEIEDEVLAAYSLAVADAELAQVAPHEGAFN